jgi:hypothetical protein
MDSGERQPASTFGQRLLVVGPDPGLRDEVGEAAAIRLVEQ